MYFSFKNEKNKFNRTKFLSTKTALVLGARGQDGALICKSLLKKNYRVIGISKKNTKQSIYHKKLEIEKDIYNEVGDITNYQTIDNLINTYQPEEIYNLAGQSSVGKSFAIPKETVEGIVNGSLNILEVAKKQNYKGRIFFAGSSEIFGHTERPATINHPQDPMSPYAFSKQTSFKLVKFYRENYNLNCVTGVLFNHESQLRNSNFVTHKIIEGAIKAKKNKSNKLLLGNIQVQRDWGWAEEYIEAMQIILNSVDQEDYVICTGKLTSLIDFINIAYSKFNLNWQDYVSIDESLQRKNEITKSYGDPSPLAKELKWKAKLKIDEIITKIIEYKLDNNYL